MSAAKIFFCSNIHISYLVTFYKAGRVGSSFESPQQFAGHHHIHAAGGGGGCWRAGPCNATEKIKAEALARLISVALG